MNDVVLERCADFVLGPLSAAQFSAWLYETSGDDWADAGDLYLELLNVDYQSPIAEREVKATLVRALDTRVPGELRRHAARRIARALIDEQVDPVEALRELVLLRAAGLGEVGLAVVGLNSELDEVPMERDRYRWEPPAYAEARAGLEVYRVQIREEAIALLRALQLAGKDEKFEEADSRP